MFDHEARGPASGTFAQFGDKTKAYFALGVHVSLDRTEGVFSLSESGKLVGRTILGSLTESERTGCVLDVGRE